MGEEAVRRWAAHGLVDPDDTSAELAEVLAFYESVGVDPADFAGTSPADLIRAVNGSMRNPASRVVPEVLRRDVGLDDELFDELCRAGGYDPAGPFTEDDVEAFSAFRLATDVFRDDELIHVVRVLRHSMDRVAHALTALIRLDVLSVLDAADAPEVAFARQNHETAQLVPLVFSPMRALFLRSLETAIDQSDAVREMAGGVGGDLLVPSTIGFVDIAGFTTVVESVGSAELARYVLEFEIAAHEIIAAHGAQLVKLIGDEVMFATVDADTALAVTEALLDRFDDRHGRPSAGLSTGQVIARGGDYYGRPVNLAARATALAGPGQVLADESTAAAVRGRSFEPVGEFRLKGFSAAVPLNSLVPDASA